MEACLTALCDEVDKVGAASMREVEALLVTEAGCARRTEVVAVEMRADVAVDGVAWTSAALSPGDWEDYAFGAAFAGGLIARADEVAGVDVRVTDDAAALDVRLRVPRAELPRAAGAVLPGCGLAGGAAEACGARPRPACAPLASEAVWRMSQIGRAHV